MVNAEAETRAELMRFPRSAISPRKLLGSLRKRGGRGVMLHALRRVGTLRGRAWTGPGKIRINPVNALCNHTCPMCWLQHESSEGLRAARQVDRDARMTLQEYRDLFDSIPCGLEEVEVVGGGEPLLHPEIEGICREIKGRGWRGTIYTNGTLLNPQLAHALIGMRWNSLRVSVHGGDRETYRRTQGVDRFDALLSNLRTYDQLRRKSRCERQCRVVIFHVIQRENLNGIDALFEIAREVGADELLFHELISYDDAMRLTSEEMLIAAGRLRKLGVSCGVPNNASDLACHLEQHVAALAEKESSIFRPARCCSVGFDEAFVSATGVVKPCCYSDEIMGEARKTPFRAIWQSAPYRDFRERLIGGKFSHYCISNRCSIREVLHS